MYHSYCQTYQEYGKGNMSRVKYGVIGLGFFGEKHIETLSGLSNVQVIAICTRRQDRLKDIGAKYNIPYRLSKKLGYDGV